MNNFKTLSKLSLVESTKDVSGTNVNQYDFFDGRKKVCSVNTFDWWDGRNIEGLEVSNDYRGQGFSYALIDYAVNVLDARNLAVEKGNDIAIHVYKKYGFVIIDEDETYLYMSINN